MNFQTMIDTSLKTIGRRVHKAPHNKLAELGSKNVHRSTFAVTETFAILTEELKNELCSLLDSLSKMNLSQKQIRIVEKMLEESINMEFDTHKEYLISINIFNIGNTDWTEFINNQKEDTVSAISVKLLILKSAALDRKIKLWWDIGKIILSATIGGIIGSYIKSLIEIAPK